MATAPKNMKNKPIVFDNKLFFAAANGDGIWSSDGTSDGTSRWATVMAPPSNPNPSHNPNPRHIALWKDLARVGPGLGLGVRVRVSHIALWKDLALTL